MSNLRRVLTLAGCAAPLALLLFPRPAEAIPAFARKYGTSCQTCHVVYPKLTPFGEAFRRNGFMFPGNDQDFTKQDTVPLGQDAYKKVFPGAVWPGTLAASAPVAMGFNGYATLHPSSSAAAAKADNGATFSMNDLVEEGHIWAGGSFSENTTFFGELTFSADGVDVEHANVHFNNLAGPKHLLNLVVGRFAPGLTSFGMHSSYVGDSLYPGLSVTALNGSGSPSFSIGGMYNGVELNGTVSGRFIYSLGADAGANVDTRTSENAYAHLGFKVGGMRLDGEGDSGGDASKPWAETSLTVDAFGYRSASHYSPAAMDPTMPPPNADDRTYLAGGQLRLQLSSFALDSGFYQEWHDGGFLDGSGSVIAGQAFALYDEASYVVFPWLVPAFRAEWVTVTPDGGSRIGDWRLIPGIATLIRPNLKLVLTAQIEIADGVPAGGWGAAGGFASPDTGTTAKEIESVTGTFAYAF